MTTDDSIFDICTTNANLYMIYAATVYYVVNFFI